jgi:predicted Zn finger-like uncharacterized protein
MKYFKCGNCQAPYKIDEATITKVQVAVNCPKCGVKNIIRLGPFLVVQSKSGIQQFPLKMGKNTLGRKSESSEADFQIEDEHVSRAHLEVSLEETENKLFITLEDKSSLNGTFNKNKLRLKPSQKYPFKKDDFVIVGLSKITLKIN